MENPEQFELELEEAKRLLDQLQVRDDIEQSRPLPFALQPKDARGKCPAGAQKRKQKQQPKKEEISWQKSLVLYVHDLIYLLAALIVISLLLVRVVVVSGTSMCNTLLDGDYLLVLSNSVYQEPKVGDVIVASKESFDDGAPIVKRVIATEGQWVDIDFELGIVYVGDDISCMEALVEPYTLTATTLREGVSFPLQVTQDHIFVLGDNRAVSRDSRSPDIGLIHKQEVLGKVIFLFLPGTNGKDAYGGPKMPRDWSRIGVVN